MQPPIPPRPRDRLAGLRLPDLPPRDLERLALAAGPHSAPAPSSGPDSAGYLPPPSAGTKFGGEGSPADVRGYTVTPLLMRGGVVSPGVGGGSGLVLPTLSLPLTTSSPSPPLPLPTSSPHDISSSPPPPPPPPQQQQQMLSTSSSSLSNANVAAAYNHAVSATSKHHLHHHAHSPMNVNVLSQTEIKKAQNRKSAKRFREAQKQRWKNMADDLMSHKRTIDELRAQLAAQASTVAHANNALRAAQQMQQQMHQQAAPTTMNVSMSGVMNAADLDAKRSSVSINDLVDADKHQHQHPHPHPHPHPHSQNNDMACAHTHAEAEAALYAQILSSKMTAMGMGETTSSDDSHTAANSMSSRDDTTGREAGDEKEKEKEKRRRDKRDGEREREREEEPYVKQLGVLTWCVVVDRASCKIVSVRRGASNGVGTVATDGVAVEDVREYRNGLMCAKAVAVRCRRHGATGTDETAHRRNVVMNPVEGCDRVVVAEFTPLQ